ncbi:MAG: corrinoid protein [Deltaproteobacteria bacterium]|nr:corrinoid protein [Deltaproteobacteria bacterium]
MTDLSRLSSSVLSGDVNTVRQLTSQALSDGIAASDVLALGLIAAMDVLGRRFGDGEVFLPDMLVAARAMHAGLDMLKPILAGAGVAPVGRVVLGTVRGDVHDLGKNLVGMMLEGAGFAVRDLGVDVSPQAFVEHVRQDGAEIVAMSALLTTTMPEMKTVIDALCEGGVRETVKVLVGGSPVTETFARDIGADGFAPDAYGAVAVARLFVAAT